MRILLTTTSYQPPGDHHGTYESVSRQAMGVTLDLVNYLKVEKGVIQTNKW